jgi:hypothetical protein
MLGQRFDGHQNVRLVSDSGADVRGAYEKGGPEPALLYG